MTQHLDHVRRPGLVEQLSTDRDPTRLGLRELMDTHGSNIDACLMALNITGDPVADQILSDDPFALLAGMMLDQQFPMERAFAGPAKILDRFGTLDPATIADAPPEEFAEMCARPPAVHRFPGSMAARLQALAAASSSSSYDGDAAALWNTADSGAELFKRLTALPGLRQAEGADLRRPARQAAGRRPAGLGHRGGRVRRGGLLPLGRRRPRRASLEKVRSFKKEQKAAAKAQVNRALQARARRAGHRLTVDVAGRPGPRRRRCCSGSTPAHTPASTSDWSSRPHRSAA